MHCVGFMPRNENALLVRLGRAIRLICYTKNSLKSLRIVNPELIVKVMTALTLPLKVDFRHVHLTDEQFYQLCISNLDRNIERSAVGSLIFM